MLRVCKPRTIKEKIIHILEDRDFLCPAGRYDCLERKHVFCEVVGCMPQVSVAGVPLLFVFGNVFPSTSHTCPLRVAGQQHTKETCCWSQRCPGEWDPMWTLSALNSFRWQCYTFFHQWRNWWALALRTSCRGIIVLFIISGAEMISTYYFILCIVIVHVSSSLLNSVFIEI